MADGFDTTELPKEQVAALTSAAAEIASAPPQSILPTNHITRSEKSTSHLISEAHIFRLRTAADRGTLSNDAQIYLGAAIGAGIPAAEGVYKLATQELKDMTLVQVLSVMLFFACVAITWSLHRAKKSNETVDSICGEIESRSSAELTR